MKQLLVKLLFFNILLMTLTHGWLLPTNLKDSEQDVTDKGKRGHKWAKKLPGWLQQRPGRNLEPDREYAHFIM